ncbi:MAG: hypothetical protein Q8922_04070 [Bacteroidota bacterium]|nr:hypothetical protein [Bacteroidota bacterium]
MAKAIAILLGLGFILTAPLAAQPGEHVRLSQASGLRGSIAFVPNRGQLADQFGKPMPEVLYSAQGQWLKFYFTKSGFHYVFTRGISRVRKTHTPVTAEDWIPKKLQLYRVDVAFTDANQDCQIDASEESAYYTNYYGPNFPAGITHVPAFRRLVYRDLYPHIDLVLYVHDAQSRTPLEYDFIVHPGGDPRAISLRYSHATSLAVTPDGTLRMVCPLGSVLDEKPYAYQAREAGKEIRPAQFHLHHNQLRFEVGAYDRSRDLVIDPPRSWGTYFGGATDDFATDLGVDRHGNTDICGVTTSSNNIATPNAHWKTLTGSFGVNGFVASFSPVGNLRWATYYGGDARDWLYGIACDTFCGPVVAGWNGSVCILGAFDSDGVIRWAKTNSGSPSGLTGCSAVAVDSSNNIIIGLATPYPTGPPPPPPPPPIPEAWIVKYNAAGTVLWTKHFGAGPVTPPFSGLACDASNHIYLGLTTTAAGLATPGAFQTTPGVFCIAKLEPTGATDWSTYYLNLNSNGSSTSLRHITVAPDGHLYFCGYTTIPGFATTGAWQTSPGTGISGILGHFDSSGHRIWCSYLGNNGTYLLANGVDTSGNVVAGGYTGQAGLASAGEYQTTLIGSTTNPFMVRFDSSGGRHWATYYGDGGQINGIGVNRSAHVSIAGACPSDTSLFATAGAHQLSGGGHTDAFIAKFCDTLEINVAASPSHVICPGTPLVLTASPGFNGYQWTLNGIPIAGANSTVLNVGSALAPGHYLYAVRGSATDGEICASKSWDVPIWVVSGPTIAMASGYWLCSGDSVRLRDTIVATGQTRYLWSPATGLDHPDSAQPIAKPTATTTYTLMVLDSTNCSASSQVIVTVNTPPTVKALSTITHALCPGTADTLSAIPQLGSPPFFFNWSPAAGLNKQTGNPVVATPTSTTHYVVTVSDANGCIARDTVVVTVGQAPKLALITPPAICPGASVDLNGTVSGGLAPYTYEWAPDPSLSNTSIANPKASPNISTKYFVTVTDSNGCASTDSVLVSVRTPAHPHLASDRDTIYCASDAATLTVPSAGLTSFVWSSGEKTKTIQAGAGPHWCVVTDANGCTGTSDTAMIVTGILPAPIIQGPPSVCPNSRGTYTSHDKGIATYEWTLSDGGTIASGSGTSNLGVTWQSAGTWTLELKETTTGGCIRDTTITVSVESSLHPQIVASGPLTVCVGDSVVLTASSGYDSYKWSTNDTGLTLAVKTTGDYSVAVTNSGGCAGTSSVVHVTVLPDTMPPPVITASSTVICEGDSVRLGTSKEYLGYRWAMNGALTGDTTAFIYIKQAGSYIVTVGTSTPCPITSAPLTFTIAPRPNASISPSGPTAFCSGDSIVLDAGANHAAYVWSLDSTAIAGATGQTFIARQSGNYSVAVQDPGTCFANSSLVGVTVYPLPAKPVVTQSGLQLTSSPSNQYFWQRNGQAIPSGTAQTITADSDGAYTVTITDAHGCSATSDPFNYSRDTAEALATVSVRRETLASPNQSFTIPLVLSNTSRFVESGVTSYAGVLRIDQNLAKPTNPASTLVAGNWMIPVAGPITMTQDTLEMLTFTAGPTGPLCGDLLIDSFTFPNARVAVTRANGQVCITAECSPIVGSSDTAFFIHSITPNPSSGAFTIEYHIPEDNQVTILLEDVLGRTVAVLNDEPLTLGTYREMYSTGTLSSGVYRLVLRSGERVLHKMIEVSQ